MTMTCGYTIEAESIENTEDKAVLKRNPFLKTFRNWVSQSWPVSFAMRALNGLWRLLGFSPAGMSPVSHVQLESPTGRQCHTARKRLHPITRLLLAVLPRRLQSALGYPVCTSIGCSVSPEVRCSPTKPCGKGSKRKQDDVDEEEQQSWVEALTQELADEDCHADPDYQPSSMEETDSEEYRTHSNTESDLEVEEEDCYTRIKEVETDVPPEL